MYNRNSFLFSYRVNFCDKDCTDRKVGCHSSCKKYLERKAKYDKNKADVRKIKSNNRDITGFEIDSYNRTVKKCNDRYN